MPDSAQQVDKVALCYYYVMWEALVAYALENAAPLAYVALLIAIVATVAVILTRFYMKTTIMCDKVPGMEATLQGIVAAGAHSKMPVIEEMLQRIDKSLSMLNQVLMEKNVISQSVYSNENSPRVVNELGEQLLTESGASVVLEHMASELIDDLEDDSLDSDLELEQASLNLLFDRRDERQFKPIQDFVFQHPTFSGNPLTYTDVLYVMSLKLRDMFKKTHPEFDGNPAQLTLGESANNK